MQHRRCFVSSRAICPKKSIIHTGKYGRFLHSGPYLLKLSTIQVPPIPFQFHCFSPLPELEDTCITRLVRNTTSFWLIVTSKKSFAFPWRICLCTDNHFLNVNECCECREVQKSCCIDKSLYISRMIDKWQSIMSFIGYRLKKMGFTSSCSRHHHRFPKSLYLHYIDNLLLNSLTAGRQQ